ncbi:DnaJ domain-containing protein [Ustulina deusta]|nr:DnaJ domain-containing protein [Ustulina deusta]
MSPTDLYETLNVPSDADVDTIQKAFKELSLRLHPDKANASTIPPGGVETKTQREAREQRNHERFVKIVEARDTLTNPAKRKEYDQKRRGKKHSTNKASKSSAASKPEKETPRQSTAHQETRVDIEGVHNSTIRSLERLDLGFNQVLSLFCRTRPRSQSPSFPAYLEIIDLFTRIIFTNTRITDRIREARDGLRSEGFTARAAYAMTEAVNHIPRARALVSELDALLVQSNLNPPHNLLYNRLKAKLTTFLFP